MIRELIHGAVGGYRVDTFMIVVRYKDSMGRVLDQNITVG